MVPFFAIKFYLQKKPFIEKNGLFNFCSRKYLFIFLNFIRKNGGNYEKY